MTKIYFATLRDIPTIQYIAQLTWPETFKDILSKDQIAYMLEMMYSTSSLVRQIEELGHIFLIAVDAEGLDCGFISYEASYRGESVTKIHKIYILPNVQGKGVGKLLFDEVTHRSLLDGIKRISLNVNKYNQAAIRFYGKIGFEIVGKEDIPIGNGYLMEDYVLEKTIS